MQKFKQIAEKVVDEKEDKSPTLDFAKLTKMFKVNH